MKVPSFLKVALRSFKRWRCNTATLYVDLLLWQKTKTKLFEILEICPQKTFSIWLSRHVRNQNWVQCVLWMFFFTLQSRFDEISSYFHCFQTKNERGNHLVEKYIADVYFFNILLYNKKKTLGNTSIKSIENIMTAKKKYLNDFIYIKELIFCVYKSEKTVMPSFLSHMTSSYWLFIKSWHSISVQPKNTWFLWILR